MLVFHGEGTGRLDEDGRGTRRHCRPAGGRSPAPRKPRCPRASVLSRVTAERPRARFPAMTPQVARSSHRLLLPPAPSALIFNLFMSLSSMFRGLSRLPSTQEHVYRATAREGQGPLSQARFSTSAAGVWPGRLRVPDRLSSRQPRSCPPLRPRHWRS